MYLKGQTVRTVPFVPLQQRHSFLLQLNDQPILGSTEGCHQRTLCSSFHTFSEALRPSQPWPGSDQQLPLDAVLWHALETIVDIVANIMKLK